MRSESIHYIGPKKMNIETWLELLEVFIYTIKQEKEIKDIHTGKKVIKLFADNMIAYVENPKDSILKI